MPTTSCCPCQSPLVGHVLRSITFTLCIDIPKQLPVQLPFLDGSFEVQIWPLTLTTTHARTARYVISPQTLNLCTANIGFSSKRTQISRRGSSLGLSLQQLSVKMFFVSNAKGSTSGEELDQVVSEETGLWCVSSCGGTECTQNKGGFCYKYNFRSFDLPQWNFQKWKSLRRMGHFDFDALKEVRCLSLRHKWKVDLKVAAMLKMT